MKILLEPPRQDFRTYIARPEVHFVQRERADTLDSLYARGYLPYSGTDGLHDVFYSARSARVVLQELTLTSENRRIAKKFDGLCTKERIPFPSFNVTEECIQFFLNYFTVRHGKDAMPRKRLETLLGSGLLSHIVEYKKDGTPLGYVLEVASGNMRHFWYSAYDLAFVRQSLGLWLMLDCIRDAKMAGVAYYYLGTVYGAKALYKTNFTPLEWWDGNSWSRDVAALKKVSRSE